MGGPRERSLGREVRSIPARAVSLRSRARFVLLCAAVYNMIPALGALPQALNLLSWADTPGGQVAGRLTLAGVVTRLLVAAPISALALAYAMRPLERRPHSWFLPTYFLALASSGVIASLVRQATSGWGGELVFAVGNFVIAFALALVAESTRRLERVADPIGVTAHRSSP